MQFFRLFLTLLLLLIFAEKTLSRPYHGEIFTFFQPDGEEISVKLYGDEFYVTIESLDGYTLIQNETTGFYEYAELSSNGNNFSPSNIRAQETKPQHLQLSKKLRLNKRSIMRKSLEKREIFGIDRRGRLVPSERLKLRPQEYGYQRWSPVLDSSASMMSASGDEIMSAPPSSTTTGKRVGLILLARFPDRPGDASISQAQVDAYANDPDYTSFGNATSIYGYFNIQSGGKLKYNCIVTAYFTAANNRDYYTDRNIGYGTRAKELINEGLAALKADGFDFTKVDGNSDGVIDGVNIFYAGSRVNNWSEGLWPHKWNSSWSGLFGEGVSSYFQYQITNMGSSLTLGTFAHENGHMICGFPDLYAYNNNAADLGAYSLMHSSGSTHPRNIDAYLKMHAGWAEIIDVNSSSHLRGAVAVDQNTFYRFQNPSRSSEYFLMELRRGSGYEGPYGGSSSSVNPTNGVVVYHAYETGSNTHSSIVTDDNPSTDYSTPFELMVVEANPSSATTPWYDEPDPGGDDGFHADDVHALSDSTLPALNFWNTSTGRTTASNMQLHSVSSQADTMTFVIGGGTPSGVPTIGVTTPAVNAETNYSANAPLQTFSIFNSGGGLLSYSISENVPWLSLNTSAGTLSTSADSIELTYDSENLTPGQYNADITITSAGATNSPQTIPVTLTIFEQPVIGINVTSISSTLQSGASGSEVISLSNSGGGTLSYNLAASDSWIELSSNSGTVAAEEDAVVVTLNAQSFFSGLYNGTISLTSSNATNSPQVILVTLTVEGHIRLLSPKGGETLWRENPYDIRWLTDNSVMGDVQIELHRGGAFHSTISSGTSNDGIYSWVIPSGLLSYDDYTIVIKSVDDTSISGESSAAFSLANLPVLATIPYSESFESGFGFFQQESNNDFDWDLNSNSTPSSNTGPSSAYAGDYYIYTEASSPNYPSKKAILTGNFDLRSATAPLMSVNHHMYGSNMGTLTIQASVDQFNWTPLLSLTGNQGNSWENSTLDLTPYAGKAVQIQFKGETGSSFRSDMALDNIIIVEASKILSYSSTLFTESTSDDGSISNSSIITLTGDTFTSDVVSGGHVSLHNLPDGLTPQITRDSASQLTLTLTGISAEHSRTDSINNLELVFDNGSFTGNDSSSVSGANSIFSIRYIESSGTPEFSIHNASLAEGNDGFQILQFTVSLSEQPGSTVSVDYSTSDGSASAGADYTAQNGQISFGPTETSKNIAINITGDQIDEADENFTIALSNNSAGTEVNDGSATGTIIDNDTAGISVSSISGNTSENGNQATFTVRLNSEPISSVNIGVESGDPSEGTVSPSSLAFSQADWDLAQTVTVSGINDDLVDGNIGYLVITQDAVSTDPSYSGFNADDVSLINVDNDAVLPTFNVGPTVATEGNIGNTTLLIPVSLSFTAGSTVTVDYTITPGSASSGLDYSYSGTTLTFGPTEISKNISVTIHGDYRDESDENFTVILSNNSDGTAIGTASATATITDDDTAGVSVSSIVGNTSEQGKLASFTIVLNSQPAADVSIPLHSSDTTEGHISTSNLIFTQANWDSRQTVIVTGQSDTIEDGDVYYTIVTSPAISSDPDYSGMDPADVVVVNQEKGSFPWNLIMPALLKKRE